MWTRIFRSVCLIAGVAGLVLLGRFYYSVTDARSTIEAGNLRSAQKDTLKMALEINNSLSQVVDATRLIQDELSGQEGSDLTPEQIRQSLDHVSAFIKKTNSPLKMQTIGIIDIQDEELSLYYIRDEQGKFHTPQPDECVHDKAWLLDMFNSIEGEEGHWSEPQTGVCNNSLSVTYVRSFYRVDQDQKQIKTVVYATLPLNDVQELINQLYLGDEGYAYIASYDCRYLAHQHASLLGDGLTATPDECTPVLSDEIKKSAIYDPANLISYIAWSISGQIILREGEIDGRPYWYFFEPIPATGWTLGVVLQKDPHNELVMEKKQTTVKLVLLLAASLFLISIFAFKLRLESLSSLWAVSTTASALIAGVIVLIWALEIVSPSTANTTVPLSNHALLITEVDHVNQAFDSKGLPLPVQIPTGIFIESCAVNGSDVTITGYVWQKFPAGSIDEENPPEVIFTDSQSQEETLAYQFEDGDQIVVGHYFRVSQTQAFSSNKYPLDLATISIQLQAADLNKNYLLVPDLGSYYETNPSGKPGIKSGLILNNWDIIGSTFTYDAEQRDVDFGSTQIMQYDLPILQFDMELKRFILPSLLSYGITAIVTAILMFSLVVSQAENLRSVLTEAFALFFVIVVAHVGLRSELASQSIAYLEILFIILYCLILMGALNGLLQFVEFKIPLISYENGLVFKLSYWPILFGVFLIASINLFYPHLFR